MPLQWRTRPCSCSMAYFNPMLRDCRLESADRTGLFRFRPLSLSVIILGRTYSPPASGRLYCLRQSCALRGGCCPCGGLPGMTTVIPGAYGTARCAALFYTPAKNCRRQVFAAYGGRRTRDGRRKTEVIETGNLSFGGKSYQSGNSPFRRRGSSLYELFPNSQRLR